MPREGAVEGGTFGQQAAQDEVSLFSSTGEPVAYLASDLTIYLWKGKPVAYLSTDAVSDYIHVYGFSGKHLGWLEDCVVYDDEGYPVGATKNAFKQAPEAEPLKGVKQIKPIKSVQELAPIRPIL